MTIVIARLMWLAPAILLVIAITLVGAGLSQKTTLESGELVTARVVDVEIRNRADVTYGHIDLRVPATAASAESTDVRLPLPLSLLTGVSSDGELAVRILDDSDQPVIIEKIARAQWRMSLIHALMCFIGALLIGWGVLAWNRYLKSNGDPARRPAADE